MTITNFERWSRTDINDTDRKRAELKEAILARYDAKDLEEALKKSGIPEKTAVIYIFGGAGTRWIDSLKEHRDDFPDINPDKPRCLAPVDNLFPTIPDKKVPIGIYNFYAGLGLGSHIMIYSTYQDEIASEIVAPFNAKVRYSRQEVCNRIGKVAGHGDAVRQAKELWKDSSYVAVLQCNEVYSRSNLILSLFLLHLLDKEGADVVHLLPMQYLDQPIYPPILDKDNIPIGTYQEKLTGIAPPPGPGLSNIGQRLYTTADFLAKMEYIERVTKNTGSYAWLNPVNHNDEFALDHIDMMAMNERRARISPVCYAEEWSGAKKVTDIARWKAAQAKVYERDGIIKF